VWSEKAGRYNTLPGVVPPKTPGKLQSLQICQQSCKGHVSSWLYSSCEPLIIIIYLIFSSSDHMVQLSLPLSLSLVRLPFPLLIHFSFLLSLLYWNNTKASSNTTTLIFTALFRLPFSPIKQSSTIFLIPSTRAFYWSN